MMTKSDVVLQNSNGSHSLVAGSPNRGAGSQDGGAGSGIRLNLTHDIWSRRYKLHTEGREALTLTKICYCFLSVCLQLRFVNLSIKRI